MAIDASTPATESTLYQLVSPELKQNCSMCFSFYYYMYGNDTGTLNINIYHNRSIHNALSIVGDQGQQWYKGEIEIADIYQPYRVSELETKIQLLHLM